MEAQSTGQTGIMRGNVPLHSYIYCSKDGGRYRCTTGYWQKAALISASSSDLKMQQDLELWSKKYTHICTPNLLAFRQYCNLNHDVEIHFGQKASVVEMPDDKDIPLQRSVKFPFTRGIMSSRRFFGVRLLHDGKVNT